MAQFAQCLCLDLANALAGDVEFFSDFFQRAAAAVLNAETQLEHFFLTGGQGAQHIHQLLLEQCERGGFAGFAGVFVGDEVAQMGVFFFTDGGFQRNRFLSDFQDLTHLVHGHIHLLGNLFGRRIMSQLLQ